MTTLGLQGINIDVDTAAAEDVCETGGVYAGQPVLPTQAAETINIVSSSTADAAAGTGQRTIRVEGLDASMNYVSETFTMNGTTPVVSTSTWTRVLRVFGLTAGSGGVNAGAITVKHNTTTANVFAVVAAGRAQAMLAAFTVPAGKTAKIKRWGGQVSGLNATAAGETLLELKVRPTGANQSWRLLRTLRVSAVPTAKVYDDRQHCPLIIGEKCDIKVTATAGSDNAVVTADIDIEW